MKHFLSTLLVLTLSLFSCSGGDSDPGSNINSKDFQGAKVYETSNDLPECDEKTDGQLFYVTGISGFMYCNGTEYLGIDLTGEQGTSISWLGTMPSPPESPSHLDAYYNSNDQVTYIWNGTEWEIMFETPELGDGYTLDIPDYTNNRVSIEISTVVIENPVTVINGPGVDIERVESDPSDLPGFSMEHPFIIEAEGTDAENITAYFDQYLIDSIIRPISLIIRYCPCYDDPMTEVFRWNLFEYIPVSYESVEHGRTRFTFELSQVPDTIVNCQLDGEPVAGGSYPVVSGFNPETDKKVEIEGVVVFYPVVTDDIENSTLTLEYNVTDNAGENIWNWVKGYINYTNALKALSVIDLDSDMVELGRRNYYHVFPIKYEMYWGFAQTIKLKMRLVIAYGYSEEG